MTTPNKIAGLALAMILILILSFSGQAQQLFLNVYVDDTSANKALVVGNVDDVSGLPFLNASDQIHQDNGQLYAVCDSLLNQGQWRNLELRARLGGQDLEGVFGVQLLRRIPLPDG